VLDRRSAAIVEVEVEMADDGNIGACAAADLIVEAVHGYEDVGAHSVAFLGQL
jgi:hypothetical protein